MQESGTERVDFCGKFEFMNLNSGLQGNQFKIT